MACLLIYASSGPKERKGGRMTGEEIMERYCIPLQILTEYKNWKKLEDAEEYSDADLDCLIQIMTLREVGFGNVEVEKYLELTKAGGVGKQKRLAMIQNQRNQLLTQIHAMEQMLERLDYLRYEVGKEIC